MRPKHSIQRRKPLWCSSGSSFLSNAVIFRKWCLLMVWTSMIEARGSLSFCGDGLVEDTLGSRENNWTETRGFFSSNKLIPPLEKKKKEVKCLQWTQVQDFKKRHSPGDCSRRDTILNKQNNMYSIGYWLYEGERPDGFWEPTKTCQTVNCRHQRWAWPWTVPSATSRGPCNDNLYSQNGWWPKNIGVKKKKPQIKIND